MGQLIIIFLLCFICGIVQTAIGFGSVIIMMAVMPLFLPAGACVIVAQLCGTALSFWMLRDLRRSIEWKKIAVPTAFAVVFGIVGLFLAKGISDAVYMKILGVLLVLLSAWMLIFSARVRIRPTTVNGSAVGLISGVLGALFAVSAPPLVLYYSASTDDKDNYTSCLQITLGLQGLITLIGRGVFDMWVEGVWLLCVPAVVGMLLGSIPGKKIYGKLDIKTFKMLIHIFIGLLGIYIFFSN